ncbi:DUF4232 domain-containing protein [Zafaria sp. J156]|uniref:DUF4232 domain-containing protein n=1 Tax=Zafaria sp. J156 TaxID=3116490 RepID=UPI002E76ACAA|nr:DUF4232 domain-containing protein [Zafaria sp. J156]MEE1620937.1 DUF4232 domain-containing protein [Zafaria sp. J156]
MASNHPHAAPSSGSPRDDSDARPVRPRHGSLRAARWAALAAALLWWGGGALYDALAAGTSRIPVEAAGLVLPTTVPRWVAASQAPWNLLVPLASALLLGALVFALARLVLPRTGGGEDDADAASRAPRFLALWFSVVLAVRRRAPDAPGRSPDAPPRTAALAVVVLEPGGAARALLGWNAMAGAGDTRAGTLLVAPYAGAERAKLPVDLDIVDGGAVAVTAWEPVGSARP